MWQVHLMASSPVHLLLLFLLLAIGSWTAVRFIGKGLALLISALTGNSIRCRFIGLFRVKDVTVVFKKGAIASLSVKEVRFSFGHDVKPISGSWTRPSKLCMHLLEVDIVLQGPRPTSTKQKHQQMKIRTQNKSGRGIWRLVNSVARIFTLNVADITLRSLQVPDLSLSLRSLFISGYIEGGASYLGVRAELGRFRVSVTESIESRSSPLQRTLGLLWRPPSQADFHVINVVHLLTDFRFFHHKDAGILLQTVDVECGAIIVQATDRLLDIAVKRAPKPPIPESSINDSQPTEAGQSRARHPFHLPDQVKVKLPTIKMQCEHRQAGLSATCLLLMVEMQMCLRSRLGEDTVGNLQWPVQLSCSSFQITHSGVDSPLCSAKLTLEALISNSIEDDMMKLQVEASIEGLGVCAQVAHLEPWLKVIVDELRARRATITVKENRTPKSRQTIARKPFLWDCTLVLPGAVGQVVGWNGGCLYMATWQNTHLYFDSHEADGATSFQLNTSELTLKTACCTCNRELGSDGCSLKHDRQGLVEVLNLKNLILQKGANNAEGLELDEGLSHGQTTELKVDSAGLSIYVDFAIVKSVVELVTSLHVYQKSHLRGLHKKGRGVLKTGTHGPTKSTSSAGLLTVHMKVIAVHVTWPIERPEARIPDPKKVNFGSMGGEVLFTHTPDGKPRVAVISLANKKGIEMPSLKTKLLMQCAEIKYEQGQGDGSKSCCMQCLHTSYQEFDVKEQLLEDVSLLTVQKADIAFHKLHEGQQPPVNILIGTIGLQGRWEPDMHIFFYQLHLDIKALLQYRRARLAESTTMAPYADIAAGDSARASSKTGTGQIDENLLGEHLDMPATAASHSIDTEGHSQAKKALVVAVDLEETVIQVAAGDGVEVVVTMQSTFSEDARVGLLLEGLQVSINRATLLSSKVLQISKLPATPSSWSGSPLPPGYPCTGEGQGFAGEHAGLEHGMAVSDYILQTTGLRFVMPWRLELRAVEDSVEDMWRCLKIAMAAQRLARPLPAKKAKDAVHILSRQPVRKGSWRIKLRDLSMEIEEEPIQGWLDQHNRLLKKEVQQLVVREALLDERTKESGSGPHAGSSSPAILEVDGVNTDIKQDTSYAPHLPVSSNESAYRNSAAAVAQDIDALRYVTPDVLDEQQPDVLGSKSLRDGNHESSKLWKSAWETLHKQTAEAYKAQCEKLVTEACTGACTDGFQGGFTPSHDRRALMCLRVADLDLVLSPVNGGKDEMIARALDLDEVKGGPPVPFSRLMGRHVDGHFVGAMVKLRDYTLPMFRAEKGSVRGTCIFAQQATIYQPQIFQNIFLGRWWSMQVLRSMSGTTPPLKFYSDSAWDVSHGDIAYSVGWEPAIYGDVSYAFTVALRKADLSMATSARGPEATGADSSQQTFPANKERSLPWWDLMRYYSHTRCWISITNFVFYMPSTADPYDDENHTYMSASNFTFFQQKGRIVMDAEDYHLLISRSEGFEDIAQKSCREPFISSPFIRVDITLDWDCEQPDAGMHYLHALPTDGKMRDMLYDPFRSIGLDLGWIFTLRKDALPPIGGYAGAYWSRSVSEVEDMQTADLHSAAGERSPTLYLNGANLKWMVAWYNLFYYSTGKLRGFARWPKFGVPRRPRSGNLALSQTLSEMLTRMDMAPCQICQVPQEEENTEGLLWHMESLKYDIVYSRNLRRDWDGISKRPSFVTVHQGLDICRVRVKVAKEVQAVSEYAEDGEGSVSSSSYPNLSELQMLLDLPSDFDLGPAPNQHGGLQPSDGFFLATADDITIKKQAISADQQRLLALWGIGPKPSEKWTGKGQVSKEQTPSILGHQRAASLDTSDEVVDNDGFLSDASDDDGLTLHLADNCWRTHLVGLKIIWTVPNRNALWIWLGDISKAFSRKKPSPSRQYTARKKREEQQQLVEGGMEAPPNVPALTAGTSVPQRPVIDDVEKAEDDEGVMKFMINIVQPQFNLQSPNVYGRFLLAAASGRVLARSFESLLFVGDDILAAETPADSTPSDAPIISWTRRELSVLLEHVQAHVAPTDVDPAAGVQWLPRVRSNGGGSHTLRQALLQQVFQPCTMYLQFNRHKGGMMGGKVMPLKDLSFNAPAITATMTSRHFAIMLDVISNLLLARMPKSKKQGPYSDLHLEDEEEERHEVVPDGIESVELAKIKLEVAERECQQCAADLRAMKRAQFVNGSFRSLESVNTASKLWMVSADSRALVQRLEIELKARFQGRKAARIEVMSTLQQAAQAQQEQAKQASPAMSISLALNRACWTLIADGEAFAEAQINGLMLHLDRDFNELGVARFEIKQFFVRNNLKTAKYEMLLSAWNPPQEWTRQSMLKVVGKHGAPVDGVSPILTFEVEIHPLRIHLIESMYKTMWEYFFPKELEDIDHKWEAWRAPTESTALTSRTRRGRARSRNDALLATSLPENLPSGQLLPPLYPHVDAVAADVGQLQPHVNAENMRYSGMSSGTSSTQRSPSRRSYDASSKLPTTELYDMYSTRSAPLDRMLVATSLTSVSVPASPLAEVERRLSSMPLTADGTPLERDHLSAAGVVSLESSPLRGSPLSMPEQKSKAGPSKGKEKKTKKEEARRPPPGPVIKKRKVVHIHHIKISQVELLVTYEGSRFHVSNVRLLMDTFTRLDYQGTWKGLFSKIKKHIIWGVLKSVAGMQGKKFKDQLPALQDDTADDSISGESDVGSHMGSNASPQLRYSTSGLGESFLLGRLRRQGDRAGEKFVSSVKAIFHSQRRKARAILRRTRGGEAEGSPSSLRLSMAEISPQQVEDSTGRSWDATLDLQRLPAGNQDNEHEDIGSSMSSKAKSLFRRHSLKKPRPAPSRLRKGQSQPVGHTLSAPTPDVSTAMCNQSLKATSEKEGPKEGAESWQQVRQGAKPFIRTTATQYIHSKGNSRLGIRTMAGE
eukprot:SM000195S05249  [mRNA]  locus=s195:34121:49736:+ [translate_table: standard]